MDPMPTYVYRFLDTGETIEVQQSFEDDALTEAPHPSDGTMRRVKRVFTPVGITFKGGGFYKTDSKSGGSSGSAATGGSSGSSGSSGSADSADSAGSGGAKAPDAAGTTPAGGGAAGSPGSTGGDQPRTASTPSTSTASPNR
jgi:predicted nucleic acid-binding Zn ribbon protein